VLFSETLAQARDLLEPGTAVLLAVEGERDGESLKLRAQTVESLDKAAQGVLRGVRVVLDSRAVKGGGNGGGDPLDQLKALLKPGGRIAVSLAMTLADAGRELEFALPGRFDVSPAQKGAISTVPGVVEVVDV
jgi:DNA polymerase-3 subunit alpha